MNQSKMSSEIEDVGMAEAVAPRERGPNGYLLKRVLVSLTDVCAEMVSLFAPWVARVPFGWFYVYCVQSGSCQLPLGRSTKSLRIEAGDILVLPRCSEHRLSDSCATVWLSANQVSWFSETHRSNLRRANGCDRRDGTNIVVCRFPKPSKECNHVLDKLPESIVLQQRNDDLSQGSRSIIEILEHEIGRSPSCQHIVEHLIKILVLQAIPPFPNGLPSPQNSEKLVKNDRMIASALGLMHSRPETAWTIEMLATTVGVSRSTLAARFLDQVGMTPLNYLRRERMQRAAELLCDETLGIKEISILVGYSSESAFSHTFKQWSGMTPGLFRRDRQQ